jgi:hypothetical protein
MYQWQNTLHCGCLSGYLQLPRHLYTDEAVHDGRIDLMRNIMCTRYKCTLSAVPHKLNFSGHMFVKTIELVSKMCLHLSVTHCKWQMSNHSKRFSLKCNLVIITFIKSSLSRYWHRYANWRVYKEILILIGKWWVSNNRTELLNNYIIKTM